MGSESNRWQEYKVVDLQKKGFLLVEDGNHGEYRPRREEFGSVGIFFIRAADLSNGRVLFESAQRINEVAIRRIRKGFGADGDVILSHKGTVGKVAYVPLDSPSFVCSPQTTFWRTLDNNKINRRYLYSFLNSQYFHDQLYSRANETDMAAYVSLTAQRTFKIVLPPIADQRAIAHILGSLDDKIELNRKMNCTLEKMAQAIFKSWFIDFDPVRAKAEGRDTGLPREIVNLFPDRFEESELGKIPKGWEAAKLADVMDIYDSKRIPLNSRQRAERKGKFRYYGAAGIMDYVDDYLFDGIYVLVGEDGSVIDNKSHPVTQYVWGQFWVNNHAHILSGKNGISNEYLYLIFLNTNIRPFVTGAVQPKVNQKNLKAIPVVLPCLDLRSKFAQLLEPLFDQIRESSNETISLIKTRNALLPKLISGELRVPDYEELIEAIS